LPEVKTDDW